MLEKAARPRGAGVQDPVLRALYFLRVWTLKEAYVKAAGRGIAQPPGFRGFSVRICPLGKPEAGLHNHALHEAAGSAAESGSLSVLQERPPLYAPMRIDFEAPPQEEDTWQLQLYDIGGFHTAALCFQVSPPPLPPSIPLSLSRPLSHRRPPL